MRNLLVLVPALAALAGAAAAAEHSLTLDLRGLDLATREGAEVAAARLARALDDYCGPADQPQPLALAHERAACRAALTDRGRQQIAVASAQARGEPQPVERAQAGRHAAHM